MIDRVTQDVQQRIDQAVQDVQRALGGNPDQPIALICATGKRSAFAREMLAQAGFTNVYDISEGLLGGPNGPGWLARDLPTEDDQRTSRPRESTAACSTPGMASG